MYLEHEKSPKLKNWSAIYFPHRIGEFPPPGVVTDPRRRNPGTGLEISLSPFSLCGLAPVLPTLTIYRKTCDFWGSLEIFFSDFYFVKIAITPGGGVWGWITHAQWGGMWGIPLG